jgi:hypothetical protein
MEDYTVMNSDMIRDMLIRRNQSSEFPEVVQHNPSEIRELEEFCSKHGILGVNFGRMSPKSTLNMLKSRMGIRDSADKTEKILLKG